MRIFSNSKIPFSYFMLVCYSFCGLIIQHRNASAEEIWPPQPQHGVLQSMPTYMPQPIYMEGRDFILPYQAYFFHTRSALDKHLNNRLHPHGEPKEQLFTVLAKGRQLKALEYMVTFQGKVFDKELGTGYVLIHSRF